MANIDVSVVYADEAGQLFDESLSVLPTATIGDVVAQSSFLVRYPHLSLETLQLGIFSVHKKSTDSVVSGDRIEIYRGLIIDPKDRRRQSVDQQRNPKKVAARAPQQKHKTTRE